MPAIVMGPGSLNGTSTCSWLGVLDRIGGVEPPPNVTLTLDVSNFRDAVEEIVSVLPTAALLEDSAPLKVSGSTITITESGLAPVPAAMIHCTPPPTARLPAVVRKNQLIIPKPRQVHEYVFQQPRPRVLPHLVRRRAPRLATLQDFVGWPVFDVDPAAVGAPPGDRRLTTLPEPAVRLRDQGVEALLRFVACRPRGGIALRPELSQPAALPIDRQARVRPLLRRGHQVDEGSVYLVELRLRHPREPVLRLGHRLGRRAGLDSGHAHP